MEQNLQSHGEFTKRAFLNGRIDLSQAEAIVDIINAKTEKEAKLRRATRLASCKKLLFFQRSPAPANHCELYNRLPRDFP